MLSLCAASISYYTDQGPTHELFDYFIARHVKFGRECVCLEEYMHGLFLTTVPIVTTVSYIKCWHSECFDLVKMYATIDSTYLINSGLLIEI